MPDTSRTSPLDAQPDPSPSSRRTDLEVSEVTGSGVSSGLTKRRMLANIARGFALGYSSCYRCGMPWKFTEGHMTSYSRSGACFPLCEHCWSELTPEERLPFYERLIDDWNGRYGCPVEPEKADAIREAVLAGG